MTLQESLLRTVQQLSPEQQQEVLDFAEFLKHKGKPQKDLSSLLQLTGIVEEAKLSSCVDSQIKIVLS